MVERRNCPNNVFRYYVFLRKHVTGRRVEDLIPCPTLDTYRTEAMRTQGSLHGLQRGQGSLTISSLAGRCGRRCPKGPPRVQSGLKDNSSAKSMLGPRERILRLQHPRGKTR